MTRTAIGSLDAADVAVMMFWLKKLGVCCFAFNPGLSGNWWIGSARSGEGFFIDVALNITSDIIFAASFYTYDSLGNQVWLVGAGPIDGNMAEIQLVIPSGAMWGEAFNPDDNNEEPWGTGTFSFTSCGAGHILLKPNMEMQNRFFTDLEYDIKRDILIPGIECPTSSD